jgi:anti-sigma regulatory factor (Ser/Thr protein kinase)
MPCYDELRLITSELVTNAVQHAHTRFQVKLIRDGYTFLLSVTDQSPSTPRLYQEPDTLRQHGRGLVIVEALATSWGIQTVNGGKSIWAKLNCAPAY